MNELINNLKNYVGNYIGLNDISDEDFISFIDQMIKVITEDYTLDEYTKRVHKNNIIN